MQKFLLLLFGLCTATALYAQPANNDCNNAISIPAGAGAAWCSNFAAYSLAGATPSGFGAATCFSSAGNDVWFSFTAFATDITITINGAQAPSAGGTLTVPQVALYAGNCGGTITQLQCETASPGSNIVELYKGGLIIGQTYLVRVQGGNPGTFQICTNNYNAPVNPGSDCPQGAILCDKSPFVVQSVTSAGNDPDEASGTCLGGGLFSNSESNSTWFRWTCKDAGTLTFTLTPNNASDDLDFVVYELPNGIDNCNGKVAIRCMAAGDFNYPSPCMGPTGLNTTATDVTEQPGCAQGQDNWVAAVNMVAGRSYALIVNNFSATGNGFGIEFGGTGTFLGPETTITTPDPAVCLSQNLTVNDQSSFAFGNITEWNWNFGQDAQPATSTAPGPHSFTYGSTGDKFVVLTVKTDRGCIVTDVLDVQVNNLIIDSTQTQDATCPSSTDGSISVSLGQSFLPFNYQWSNGVNTANNPNIAPGNYQLQIEDGGACDTSLSFTVSGPPPYQVQVDTTNPSCAGGSDGAISVQIQGATPPYTFSWSGGLGNQLSISNLVEGIYSLSITDAVPCDTVLNIEIAELELALDSSSSTIQPPSCFGFNDGALSLEIGNGTAPYSFTWANGATTNSLSNLSDGSYTLTEVSDAFGCTGGPFDLTLIEPDTLVVEIDSFDTQCPDSEDGALISFVSGGTQPYNYLWSNGSTDSAQLTVPAGFYELNVLDFNNCPAFARATIFQPPSFVASNIFPEEVNCFGGSDGSVLADVRGGTPDYRYRVWPFGDWQNSLPIENLPAGTHWLTWEDANGCQDSASFFIDEPLELLIDAGPNRQLILGDSLNSRAWANDFISSYQWRMDAAEFFCDTCRTVALRPIQPGWVYLEARNLNGCPAQDSFFVELNREAAVFLPDAFTPNSDGLNEQLVVFGGQSVRRVTDYQIFDRWGEQVYQAQDLFLNQDSRYWDGSFKGRPMNPGVFVCMVEVEFWDGTRQRFAQDVTLLY